VSVWWPEISDTKSAREATLGAVGAAVFVTAATALFAVLGWTPKTSYLDAALFALVAWRIYSMSKVWSIIGCLLYVFELGHNIYARGFRPSVGAMGALLLAAFVAGIRGTFAHSKFSAIAQHAVGTTGPPAL
jgi:hypothetical protein